MGGAASAAVTRGNDQTATDVINTQACFIEVAATESIRRDGSNFRLGSTDRAETRDVTSEVSRETDDAALRASSNGRCVKVWKRAELLAPSPSHVGARRVQTLTNRPVPRVWCARLGRTRLPRPAVIDACLGDRELIKAGGRL